MKKVILATWLLAAPALLWAQQPTTITGTIEGIPSGKLYLTARVSETHRDTLAVAPFSPQGFSMKHIMVKEPLFAQLSVEGYQGGFSFILEPGSTYQARLKNGNDWMICGGVLQERMRLFETESHQRLKQLAALQQRCDSLRKNMRYGTASKMNDSIQQLQNAIETYRETFLASNDNLLSAQLILQAVEQHDASLDESRQRYEGLGNGAKQSRSGLILQQRVARLSQVGTGKLAPDFTLPTSDGQLFTLSQMKGKIKIVDFWASWCYPCRLNNPILKQLYSQFHAQGLEIVHVSLDENRQRWLEAIAKDGLTWTQVSSLKGWKDEVARQYNVSAIPAMFILDSDNHILASGLRGDALRNFIAQQFEP